MSTPSHAWAALLLPGGHWLAVDPTKRRSPTAVHHRRLGRDYGDVPPLRGVIFTEARTSSMDVAVDVEPL